MSTARWRLIGVVVMAAVWATPVAAQTVALERVMRAKLGHAQQLLADVVTSNWAGIEQHSEALQRATKDPAWEALMTPEYVRQTAAFLRANGDLLDAAKRRDLDATPLAYVSLTMSCVQCHRYVARLRVARSPLAP